MSESDPIRVSTFFVDANSNNVLGRFLSKAETVNLDEVSTKYLDRSRKIIEAVCRSPQDWDKRCGFNIQHIGSNFLECLRNFTFSKTHFAKKAGTEKEIEKEIEKGILIGIYVMSYRFLCEFDFFVGDGRELNMELSQIKNAIADDSTEMNAQDRSQIIYALYMMPAAITKYFLNNSDIGIFKDFNQKKLEAENLKKQWDKELGDKQKTVDDLKDKLEQYKIGFNFVGLYQGFLGLVQKKEKEASLLFGSLIAMGLTTVVPLLVAIWQTFIRIQEGESFSLDNLMISIPLISLEIILIYFFRVILLNHRSVKTQIMQIELRQTLCQFIQSYAEYSAKIKAQDSTSLEKFENLIFSGLLSDPDKLPGTFDGLKPIGDFIKSIKGSQ